MNIFVGCSSRNEIPEKYVEDSKKLLNELFKENDLVFGADNTGLMGLSHDIASNNNRSITGICPEKYKHDFKNLNCNKEIITENVNDRNTEIVKNSDLLLFLPGGLGTLCEMLTAIETKRNHEHDKPIIIYNSNNYYDELIKLLDKIYNEQFANTKCKEYYTIMDNKEEIINYVERSKEQKQKVRVR